MPFTDRGTSFLSPCTNRAGASGALSSIYYTIVKDAGVSDPVCCTDAMLLVAKPTLNDAPPEIVHP
jgi:hypothetical protein